MAAAQLPPELDDAEEAIWKAGIPTFLDNFRGDATALYKCATGRKVSGESRWVDLMDYNEVIKVLRSQYTWNWGYYRDGDVERFIVHRIEEFLKRAHFTPKHLVDYKEGGLLPRGGRGPRLHPRPDACVRMSRPQDVVGRAPAASGIHGDRSRHRR